jgi:hypothetical protein
LKIVRWFVKKVGWGGIQGFSEDGERKGVEVGVGDKNI